MSYIDKNLLADEQVLFRTRKHLIIFFIPVLWLIFSIFATNYMLLQPILSKLAFFPWVLAAFLFAQTWLNYVTSEFVVTSKRIMMREGFFFRHANEMRLATISQVNIDQSLVGQVLNYGTVTINAFGVTDAYSLIDKPFLFQKAVNQQLDTILNK